MNAHTPSPTTPENASFGQRQRPPGLDIGPSERPAGVRFGPPSWRLAIIVAVIVVVGCMIAAVMVKRHTESPLFAPTTGPVAVADAQVAAAKAKAAAAAARKSAAAAAKATPAAGATAP